MKQFTSFACSLMVVALALVTSSTVAWGSQPSDDDKAFERVLRGIDSVPDRRALERRFPDAQDRLVKAAQQETRGMYTRLRAIAMLSMYPVDRTRRVLTRLAAHRTVSVRRMGVYIAARTFGTPGDADLVALVRVATADTSSEVRLHAIRALRWVDHVEAEDLLKQITKSADVAMAALARRTLEKRAARMHR